MNVKGIASTLLLGAIAAALTVTTYVLAPLPLLLLRRNEGRFSFFAGTLVAGSLLFEFVSPVRLALLLAAAVLAFVYSECENQNLGYTSSGIVTLLVICGLSAIGVGLGMQIYGLDPVGFFRSQANIFVTQLALPPEVKIDVEAGIRYLPSAFLIIIILSIWMNSVLISRLESLLGWKHAFQKNVFPNGEFRKWKLPDNFVWLALASAAGALFEVQPAQVHWIAGNVFTVVVLLYFFQGFAIIVDFFAVKQVGPLWKAIAYLFIFTLTVSLMVSFVGFVDLWMDFRKKIKSDTSAVA
jgi:hypothetical protein